MNIKRVTVVGANGNMGIGISAIFASYGKAYVYMIAKTYEKALDAKTRACKLIKNEGLKELLIPKKYEDLEECIDLSDAVFESVSENYDVKYNINREIGQFLTKEKYVFTGTSGISISELSKAFSPEIAKHYCGMHFSNPPYIMTMGEMVKGSVTDETFFEEACMYAKNVLKRDVFVANNTPGFLGNRIAFRFLNEVLMGAANDFSDKGGIDYVDALFRGYTGRIMAPLRTVNLAKLTVYEPIIKNIYDKMRGLDPFIEDYKLPDIVRQLIEDQKNQSKIPCLYMEDHNKELVFDIKRQSFREINKYSIGWIDEINALLREGYYEKARNLFLSCNSEEADFCKKLLAKYVLHALYIVKEEKVSYEAVDTAIATGYNWCPPLAFVDYLGKDEIINISNQMSICVDAKQLLDDIPSSKYDYRRYLCAN